MSKTRALLLFLTLPAMAAPAAASASISAAEKAVIDGIPEDEAPKKLDATRDDLEGRHYLSGDEANLDVFYAQLKDLGGAYAGVGSDQAYLFAGWMRPRYVFVTDYDPWIKLLHLSYAAFFEKAETIEAFRAYWKDPKAGVKLINETYEGRRGRRVRFVYAHARHKVHRRLGRLRKWMGERKIPSFVNDQATYDFVRALVRDGRVRPLVCNLLDDRCLVGVGEATRKLGVPLRVLYTSNAEQYWPYGEQFRANMQAQNFDDKSLILRTLAAKRSANKDYQYNTQPGLNFQAWLKRDWVSRVRTIVPLVFIRAEDHVPLTHEDRDPDAVRDARMAKKAKKRAK